MFISIAESADAKRDAYEHAADEIIAWQKENPTKGLAEAGRILGRGKDYLGALVRWRTNPGDRALPFRSAGRCLRAWRSA